MNDFVTIFEISAAANGFVEPPFVPRLWLVDYCYLFLRKTPKRLLRCKGQSVMIADWEARLEGSLTVPVSQTRFQDTGS